MCITEAGGNNVDYFSMIIAMEIMVVNIISSLRCFHRKCSKNQCILVLALFSFVLCGVRQWFVWKGVISGDNIRFWFMFVYVIPYVFLFREKISVIVVIMCLCYNYTLSIYILSRQFARSIGTEHFSYNLFAMQTVLLFLTMIPYHRIIVQKFVYILQHVGDVRPQWKSYLSVAAVVNFVTLLLIYSAYYGQAASLRKIMIIICQMITMYLMYNILYEILVREQQIDILDRYARQDELTGLHNRRSMLNDLERMVHTKDTFSLVFMDLDRFKQINDVYGHMVGDQYLRHFARVARYICGSYGKIYRFGGDEFILICAGQLPEHILERLRDQTQWATGAPCKFLGVSVGVMLCEPPHPELNEIIALADQEMYRRKHGGKRC